MPTTGGIFSDVLCVGNDEVLSFFRKVFAEVAEIFPGPYIHMGGDECPHTAYETCPKCQQRIRDGMGCWRTPIAGDFPLKLW